MVTQEQMALWELEYLKASASGSTLDYIMKYAETENPFVDDAIRELSHTEKESEFRELYSIHNCRLTRQHFVWADRFRLCKTQKDYEAYFMNYCGDKNNPFLDRVEQQIIVRNSIPLIWRLLIMSFGFVLSVGLLYLSYLCDGTSNIIIAFACIACMLGSGALFICCIVFACSPSTFIRYLK